MDRAEVLEISSDSQWSVTNKSRIGGDRIGYDRRGKTYRYELSRTTIFFVEHDGGKVIMKIHAILVIARKDKKKKKIQISKGND